MPNLVGFLAPIGGRARTPEIREERITSIQVDDSTANRDRDRLRAIVNRKLGQDILYMALDRLFANPEFRRNLLVPQTPRQHLQNFGLALGQSALNIRQLCRFGRNRPAAAATSRITAIFSAIISFQRYVTAPASSAR
jgi:hypothetical protein